MKMNKIKLDQAQRELLNKLAKTAKNLEDSSEVSFFQRLFKREEPKKIKSLYIYSAPGRGKTMLMQKFYQKINKTPKSYFHFNEFMYQIHKNLHKIRSKSENSNDEIIKATESVIKSSKIICFDEFQVQDIADAMLLGRIFTHIFSKNITLIITSNTKPQNLYKNGLQREKFLEFINNILLKNIEIIKIDDEIDYRLQYQQNLEKRYFTPKNNETFKEILPSFIEKQKITAKTLKIWGRDVKIRKTFEKTALLNFNEIIQDNLSASDFKEISRYFDLIIIENLPQFSFEEKNEQRRFMLFIDEIYENKTALIISAKSEIDEIYLNQKDKKSNARVISRLQEIKSDHYWKNSKFIKNQKNA